MAEAKLERIREIVEGIEEPGDFDEASQNASDGGNFDDAFSDGVEMGEQMLAQELREIINE